MQQAGEFDTGFVRACVTVRAALDMYADRAVQRQRTALARLPGRTLAARPSAAGDDFVEPDGGLPAGYLDMQELAGGPVVVADEGSPEADSDGEGDIHNLADKALCSSRRLREMKKYHVWVKQEPQSEPLP